MARRARRGIAPALEGAGSVVTVASVFGIGAGLVAAVGWLASKAKKPSLLGFGLGATYTEPPGTPHQNADGSWCAVFSPTVCVPLSPCDPGYRPGDGVTSSPFTCVPINSTGPCPSGQTRAPDGSCVFNTFKCADGYDPLPFDLGHCVSRFEYVPPIVQPVDFPPSSAWNLSWWPPGDGDPKHVIPARVRAPDPLFPRGALQFDFGDGTTERWKALWAYLQSAFPADDVGVCTGAEYPLPLFQFAGLGAVPCMARRLVDKALDVSQEPEVIASWQRAVAVMNATAAKSPTNAVLADRARTMAEGTSPFVTFPNLSRTHLNQQVTVNGQAGTQNNSYVGLYYGSKTTGKLVVRNMTFFDKDFNAFEEFFNPMEGIDAILHVVVDGILVPVAKALYDAVKAIACNAVGETAAIAAGTSQGGAEGAKTAVALYHMFCSGTSTPTPPPSSSSTPSWVWVAAGTAGVAAVGGLGYLALRKKKKGAA